MTEPATTTHKVVDSRGSACPGPITDLALAYRRAKVGDVIELWATDPGVEPDTLAWAEKTRNRVVSVEHRGGDIVVVLEILHR
ncbi:MAG TPA: sulfurtransferase TusA family protein [Jatrophihabitans sp.]|nr:sulfurtransferase TusA family protein [Jatrophihabitans sp.]